MQRQWIHGCSLAGYEACRFLTSSIQWLSVDLQQFANSLRRLLVVCKLNVQLIVHMKMQLKVKAYRFRKKIWFFFWVVGQQPPPPNTVVEMGDPKPYSPHSFPPLHIYLLSILLAIQYPCWLACNNPHVKWRFNTIAFKFLVSEFR